MDNPAAEVEPDVMLLVADDIVDSEMFEVICEREPTILDSIRRDHERRAR
jgi:hypothetical protein